LAQRPVCAVIRRLKSPPCRLGCLFKRRSKCRPLAHTSASVQSCCKVNAPNVFATPLVPTTRRRCARSHVRRRPFGDAVALPLPLFLTARGTQLPSAARQRTAGLNWQRGRRSEERVATYPLVWPPCAIADDVILALLAELRVPKVKPPVAKSSPKRAVPNTAKSSNRSLIAVPSPMSRNG